MTNWKEHKELQEALQAYLVEHDLVLPDDAEYESSIDCVAVVVQDDVVFWIGLPPPSNYEVDETEHTDKHLRPHMAVAV